MESKSNAQTKQIDVINEQLKVQLRFAFNDLVRVALDENDSKYIGKLYMEIRDRLTSLLKKDSATYIQIHQDFDVELLEELMKNQQLTTQSLRGMVRMTFKWIHDLQAPHRDSESEAAKQRVFDSGDDADSIVPSYLNETHACLDTINHDIEELVRHRNHPVVKEMLARGVRIVGKGSS